MTTVFEFQPHLTGPTLLLRPLAPSDWAALFAIGGDPAVWALHPQPDRYTEANFRAYFDDALASGGALIAVTQTGAVCGCSRFSALYAEPDEIEIGWTFLGRPWWGGAANAEMKRLMLTTPSASSPASSSASANTISAPAAPPRNLARSLRRSARTSPADGRSPMFTTP